MPVSDWLPTLPTPKSCHAVDGKRMRCSVRRLSGSGNGFVFVLVSHSLVRAAGAPQNRRAAIRRLRSAATSKRLLRLRSSSTIRDARWCHIASHGVPSSPALAAVPRG